MASLKPAFIHILIVNYNTYQHTIECLESILKQQIKKYQIVIVDNSEDETPLNHLISWCNGDINEINTSYPEMIYPLAPKPISFQLLTEQSHYDVDSNSKIIFIKAKENNGFAAANNVGLNFLLYQPKFEWVWLLNNDTIIYFDCLNHFLKGDFDGKTGMVGTKLYYYSQPNILQGIGGVFNKWLGTVKHVGEGQLDLGQYDKVNIQTRIDYIIGASLFVSKEFILSVGLMCEDYFLYFEELDWKIRGEREKWRFDWLPLCKVLHKEGSTISAGGKSIINDVCNVKNRILITKKFYPLCLLSIYPLLLVVVLNRIRRFKFYNLKLLFNAIVLNQEVKNVLKINVAK